MNRRTRATRRGFTAIEVMMSLTILAIGAAGVIAMQKAAIQGNQDARNMDEANAIGRQWMDRIKRDATLWTPSDNGPITNLPDATLLNENIKGTWFLPKARLNAAGSQNDVESAGFDPLARDLPTTTAQLEGATLGTTGLKYCTHLRITPLSADSSLMRVEVRVFWPSEILKQQDDSFCNQVPPAALDVQTDTYHFVYLVSAVRMNVLP